MNQHFYQPPQITLWTGRPTNPEISIQYWYQAVQLADLRQSIWPEADIGLLGYACDEGVRRNQGRTGAAQGPESIRRQLAKIAFHLSGKKVVDFGNIQPVNEKMEETQEYFAQGVFQLLHKQIFPIGLGGGHDIAYAHVSGLLNYLKQKQAKASLGVINLDAHFDLRPVKGRGNSGTPFYQLLSEWDSQLGYLPIGIQAAANPPQLFAIARQQKVPFIKAEECQMSSLPSVLKKVADFIQSYDYIYLSIDLDGFSSAFAPGVSAPSVMGFTPYFAQEIISAIIPSGKLISCDIAELNPKFDRDQQTAQLAARLINKISLSL
ncbi:MAG TPA: formimidoylglutamase [Saprospiraceae bacterium]|nr:formimidoylglutamase [Saprospiraceae bacterium]